MTVCPELPNTVLRWPAGGECDECRTRVKGATWGEETRYLSGSTEKVPEEELKQQQNRNRNSEEGLQSGEEGKQTGLGMAPDLASCRH